MSGAEAFSVDEREVIADLARRERFARDTADWDALEDCFWPDALIRTTWFKGSAADFIAGSRQMRAGGMISKHEITPARIRIVGDRALVESNGQVLVRMMFKGVECDGVAWTRFFSRVRRQDGVWRLASWDAIYVKDRLDPVDWTQPPEIDRDALARCRPAYRHFHYTIIETGGHCNDDLPGDDRPEVVREFYGDAERWLSEADEAERS
jgi:SnoaL-like protein